MATDDRTTPLDDQFCFALHAATRAVAGLYRDSLDALGLTYPEYLVLLLLWEEDERTKADLQARLGASEEEVESMIKALHQQGYVEREHGRVRLTAKARTVEPRAREIQCEVADATGQPLKALLEMRDELQTMTGTILANRYQDRVPD